MTSPVRFLKIRYYPEGDITQLFGENKDLYNPMGLAGHNGVDIVRPWGEPIYSIEAGEVVDVKNDPHGYGKNVRIVSTKKNKAGYYNEWVYGHNSENLVVTGQQVKEGQQIAKMGNTGFTISGATPFWKVNPFAGTHVHVGLRHVKRTNGGWTYPDSDLSLQVVNYSNGYKGAIDPILELVETAGELYPLFRQLLTIRSIINSLKIK